MYRPIHIQAFGRSFDVTPRVGFPLLGLFVALALFQGYNVVRAMALLTGIHFFWCLLAQVVLTMHIELKTDRGGERQVGLLPAPVRTAVNWALVGMTLYVLFNRAEWFSFGVVAFTTSNAVLNTIARVRRGGGPAGGKGMGMFAQGLQSLRATRRT